MLKHLYIKNFTIISRLDLELDAGLTVLTGETGAGKSILIDALEIALGERADVGLIRQGANRCEVTAIFAVDQIPSAQQWLQEHGLEENEECILSRTISRDGRSRNTINGRPCPLQQVRELSALLVHIQGQHQQQMLLKMDYQCVLLDGFAQHLTRCQQVQDLYRQWRSTQNELDGLKNNVKDQDSKIALLEFQLEELIKLGLQEGELAQLEQEYKQLTHAEQLITRCQQVLEMLAENEQHSALNNLHTIAQQLHTIENIDSKIHGALELINNAIIQTEEATAEVQRYLDHLELNPERLNAINQRLTQIHDTARKHRISPEQLIDLQQRLNQQLQELREVDTRSMQLQEQMAAIAKDYHQCAQQLSASRKRAAQKLKTLITKHINSLGMPQGQFQVQFIPQEGIHRHGNERIEFQISANPGQPLQPLNKVASGGELSRIALAIQVITAQKNSTPTLIFDEVDVGIGGSTAEIVGQLLKTLGETAQVLCVTHLPQVAAQGRQHLYIKKDLKTNETETSVSALAEEEKVKEIARMLGGVTITKRTLAHAREMLMSGKEKLAYSDA